MLFQERRFDPPDLTGDWSRDGPSLVRHLVTHFSKLAPDDYLEKVWTPVLTFATPGDLSVAYTTQVGIYTKIGRVVVVSYAITTSTFTFTTATGALQVTGLPFVANASCQFNGALSWGGITKAGYTNVVGRVATSAQLIDFVASGSGVARSQVVAADTPTGGTVTLNGTVIYSV